MVKKTLLGVCLVIAAAGTLSAQATATINGRVVDQNSAAVPGATVTVTSRSTGTVRETVSNAEGPYSVPALNPGRYDVAVRLVGFATTERENIELLTGSTLTIDIPLGIAAIEERVTVSGQAPLVEATQAIVSSSIRQTEVATLPICTVGAGTDRVR